MDRFKNIFKKEQTPGSPGRSPQSPSRTNGSANGQTADNISTASSDAEGFLCPMCMKSFASPDVLQQHFDSVHGETPPPPPTDKELELLRMQLTASEESRSLLSTELINMQKQMQELAAKSGEVDYPDLSGELKQMNTKVEMLQIENTELGEKSQLADNQARQLQGRYDQLETEQRDLVGQLNTEKEKFSLVSNQLNQEKERTTTLQSETKSVTEQLRKAEIAYEQLKSSSTKADEMSVKLSGKEELCRNLEQQINELKQSAIKNDSEVSQLRKTISSKDEAVTRSSTMHTEMKTAMESKISSMEALIHEKTGTLDRTLAENEQLQHKTQTLESRLTDSQIELSEANKKYSDLHQNFVERIDAGEGTNVIVTQLKEETARIQEKLKHTEERLQTEKEDNYQKLRASESAAKDLEKKLESSSSEAVELKEKIAKLENNVELLRTEHEHKLSTLDAEHSSTITEIQSSIASKEQTIAELENNIREKDSNISHLNDKVETVNQEVSTLQSELSQKTSDAENLQHLNTQLQEQNKEKTEELTANSNKLTDMGQQLENQSQKLSALEADIQQLHEKNDKITSEYEQHKATHLQKIEENEAMANTQNERITGLESDLKSSEDLLQEKLSALGQYEEDYAQLNEEILTLKENLSLMESEKNRTLSENSHLQGMISSLESEKLALVRESESLQGRSDTHSSQLSQTLTELEGTKQLLMERDATIITLNTQVESQSKESESLQGSLLQQIDRMESAAKQAENLKQTELTGLNSELAELKAKTKKQSETNAALAKEHAAEIEKTTLLESQLVSLQSANDDLDSEVSTLQTQMDKKSDDHSHVLQETTEILQRTSDENEALNRALAELKTEKSMIEEQLQNAQTSCDDWQSKHRLLQDDIEAVRQAITQEKTTCEETKQLMITNKLEMQSRNELLEEEKNKLKIELDEAQNSLELAEEQAEQSRTSYNASIDAEKSKLEEAEAKFNMQLVSLTENLSYNKTDLTATQEKLMDVVKHNDELRGFNLELETKLEAASDERNMIWDRCIASEKETVSLREEKEKLKNSIESLNAALHELGRENQSLQIKTTKAQSRKWAKDDEVTDCSNCTKTFSVTVRKHHCRSCGNIFCHECSSKQAPLPASAKPVRVCDNCYVELNR